MTPGEARFDSASAATCEILAGIFFDLGLAVDAQSAQALFTGLLTDTGQFRFASTSRRCFVLAGELVQLLELHLALGLELLQPEADQKGQERDRGQRQQQRIALHQRAGLAGGHRIRLHRRR